ncbi:hypothetical protein SCLCIDRAFT_1159873 [Scleroderma citrinum Foug A]|uniref:Uncharacterized protein n=1 Tax=Scleroderma citrinum Foug A TaxID=1036808 RepID=A0A0C3CW38_9AGAM|nr:hypothetical protein SCLCIDRAFT_1159873 [Scleroderma citrinum Foug A]
MSESLQASTRVSSGFALFRHSSPSFGSQHTCSTADPSPKAPAHYMDQSPEPSRGCAEFVDPSHCIHMRGYSTLWRVPRLLPSFYNGQN